MAGSRRKMTTRTMVGLAIGCLVVGAVAGLGVFSFGQTTKGEFWLNSDPGLELLKVKTVARQTGITFTSILHGDGRLVMQVGDYGGSVIFETLELELAYEEVITLMRAVVDAGLMEYDDERARLKMGYQGKRVFTVNDGLTFFLTVNLPGYQGPGQREPSSRSVSIVLDDPQTVADLYPEIEELQGLKKIDSALRAYREIAKRGQNEK
jgi:hypothetical protein